jgi:hypothetical protein
VLLTSASHLRADPLDPARISKLKYQKPVSAGLISHGDREHMLVAEVNSTGAGMNLSQEKMPRTFVRGIFRSIEEMRPLQPREQLAELDKLCVVFERLAGNVRTAVLQGITLG